ncbi:MAG: CpsD/CapB family tyrosine-protein kinase [Chloroflexota bacterium]|nr:CpsD/CapB family tyrosine-protein kinase [Chloroflexota bacterium]
MSSSGSDNSPTSLAPLSRNGRALSPAGASSGLVMLAASHSPAAEAYRALAANLQFSYVDNPLHVIGVTSAGPGEGKSTAVANLAVALAEGGRQVIAIDADLRHPELHSLFGLDNNDDGLSTALVSEMPLPLQHTGAPGVRVLAAGPAPANPVELLASRRLDRVLAQARSEADYVLVDSAPAGALADAAVLAPRLGGILLVVSAGRTRRELARRAREQLERVRANLLGVVLVDVNDDKLYRY